MAKYPIKQSLKNISEIISKVGLDQKKELRYKCVNICHTLHCCSSTELLQNYVFTFMTPFYWLQQVTQIDNDLKTRASAYNNLKGNLQNLERKNA